jgi:regulator of protease activity HflC (stomatin/prohibitin superfamily)
MADQNDVELVKRVVKRVALGTVGLVAIGLILGSWYTVDEGERAVVLTMGEFSSVAEPGLNFKLPFLQSARTISVRNEVLSYERPFESYSFDQQAADIVVSVNVQATDVEQIYKRYGSLQGAIDRIVSPNVPKTLKITFGKFTAQRAIQERDKLNAEFFTELQKAVAGTGLEVLSTQVENIGFRDGYINAVEAAASAKADVERARSELLRVEQEAQQKVKQAEAEATAKRLQADADAYATEAAGKATANAIRERGEALRQNPSLIGLVAAERWDGKLPISMPPAGSVPFVNIPSPTAEVK